MSPSSDRCDATADRADATADRADGPTDDPADDVVRGRPAGPLSTLRRPDGRRVAYAEFGAPDGEPVLFLHGTPGSRLLGGLFADAARERGLRILAPDRPGYGRSEPIPNVTPSSTAADLVAALDDAGVERAPVVAFSGGAAFAYALAGSHGDRVTAVHAVSGVVPPELREHEPRVQRLLGTLARWTPRLLAGLVRGQAWVAERGSPGAVVSQYTDERGREALPDDEAETFRREFVAGVGPQRAGFVAETRLLAEPWPVEPSAVDAPVHCWHGERDGNVPVDDARRLRDATPGLALTILDTDHATTLSRSRDAVLDACVG